ncbi:MAG: glutaredoxin 3 [Rhodanobacteraceae bacterium]
MVESGPYLAFDHLSAVEVPSLPQASFCTIPTGEFPPNGDLPALPQQVWPNVKAMNDCSTVSGAVLAIGASSRQNGGRTLSDSPRVPRIDLYTSSTCLYCTGAKNILRMRGLAFEEIRIDLDPARREEMLARSGGRRSVPQVFINNIHIGGYEDLVSADRSGRLAELIGEDR